MKKSLAIYHALPSPLWPVFASIQACKLRMRRYGPLFREALPVIRERTWWGKDRWTEFQARQLAEVLNRARAFVPAYRGLPLAPAGADPLRILASWPLLDLADFRQHPNRYRDLEFGARNCITLHTSGSSGTPKTIIRDRRAEQLNYAYAEARWHNIAGVSREDRWAMIGGQMVVPVSRQKPPFWVAAYPTKQLYLSSYHLHPEFAKEYMLALRRWQPVYILGYPSSLDMLAQFSILSGIEIQLKAVLSNAEPLYAHTRERLSRVFKCPVFDTYGSTEAAFQGFECQKGRMHVSPDFGVLEILREDNSPCAPGEVGRAVVTGLTNRAMPLVRYPSGDLLAWALDQDCACGCSFPIIGSIEGRMDDSLYLPNGRRVGRLDPVFKGNLPLREAQIIQRINGSIEVLVVPDDREKIRWGNEHELLLRHELELRLGRGVEIAIRRVESIPRGANNKFKAVVRERGPNGG